VENVEAEAPVPAPVVEVVDDDAPVHPPTATSKVAEATVAANRWAALFNGTNDRVYSGTGQ
jgi:hypothetical protein